MELDLHDIARQITETVVTRVNNDIGAAIAALAFAVRAQPGIDNDKLTEDMEGFLSRYSATIGQPIPHAWQVLRL